MQFLFLVFVRSTWFPWLGSAGRLRHNNLIDTQHRDCSIDCQPKSVRLHGQQVVDARRDSVMRLVRVDVEADVGIVSMSCVQRGQSICDVHAGVLCKCTWHELERVREL